MQIELIETFLDLCETRSFNKTAERLGVTQSTVSGRVRTLEKLLERKLFTRSRSGTELTVAGTRFAPHARSLRISWAEAIHAARDAGASSMTLRVGIQHDLAGTSLGDWIRAFRAGFPHAAFYIEADFSTQMCADLMAGELDLALLFTPKPHPDLHFDTLGEIRYVMVSTTANRLEEVEPDSYILANFSPAFGRVHAEIHPSLSSAPVRSGQDATVAGLLLSLGGTAYLREETAARLIESDGLRRVEAAPVIPQTVYAAVHLKNRTRAAHRRLLQMLKAHFTPG